MNTKRPLFLLSGLLLGALALASCSKDEETAQSGDVVPAGTTIRFDLSGEFESDLRASDVTIALTPTGNITPSLEGKTTFPGKIFITDSRGTTTSHSFTWDVVGNRLETTQGAVAVTFDDTRPAPFKVRVTAGDIPRATQQANFANAYSAWVIDGQKVSMNIPFYAEATVPYNATTFYRVRGLTLKPIGFFVRCQVANETGIPVTIKDAVIYSQGYLLDNGELSASHSERLIVRPLRTSDGATTTITIPAGQTSAQSFLVWTHGYPYAAYSYYHKFDIRVRPDDRHYSVPIYSEITPRNGATHGYASGKVYKTTIYLRKMPNPLSRLSEYPVHKDGTRFVTDWSDYLTITNPDNRVDDFEVGFFTWYEALTRGINVNGYRPFDPARGELTCRSIFPKEQYDFDRSGSYTKAHGGFQIGSLARFAYDQVWQDHQAHAAMVPGSTKSLYRLVLMGVDPMDNAFQTAGSIGDELTDHLRYACRYTWNKPGFPPASMVIEARHVGYNPAIATAQDLAAIDDPSSASYNPTFWDTAEHRVFPAYGTPGTTTDYLGTTIPTLLEYRKKAWIYDPSRSVPSSWASNPIVLSSEGIGQDYHREDKYPLYLYKYDMN